MSSCDDSTTIFIFLQSSWRTALSLAASFMVLRFIQDVEEPKQSIFSPGACSAGSSIRVHSFGEKLYLPSLYVAES